MKRHKNLLVSLTIFWFVLASLTPAYSSTVLLNKSCTKLKATKVSNGKNLTCVSKSGKKVWALTPKSNLKQPLSALPAPSFTLVYSSTGSNSKTPAVLIGIYGVTEAFIKKELLSGFNVSARSDGEWTAPSFIEISKSDLIVQGQKIWASNYEIGPNTLGKNVAVKVQAVANGRVSAWSEPQIVSTFIPTPVTTPAPVSTPTPTPVTSAAPIAEVGCSVNYLSPLPYASQRMSITSMAWEKDSLGYVSVNMSIRNDNSMALRLVEFTFYLMHKGSIIITTSTLEGNHHFYIQDDTKFNSTDGIRGAWMPGQTRVFKIPTDQMLECKSISVLSSGYTVKQGIGAS